MNPQNQPFETGTETMSPLLPLLIVDNKTEQSGQNEPNNAISTVVVTGE
jgi:hypothetical protein